MTRNWPIARTIYAQKSRENGIHVQNFTASDSKHVTMANTPIIS